MDRTLVYQNLNRLIEKGVINSIIENNVHYFFIGDIKNICFPIKKKQTLVESIIPQLYSINNKYSEEQQVVVYQGEKGVKSYIDDIINSKKEIFVIGGLVKLFNENSFKNKINLNKFISKNFKAKIIVFENKFLHIYKKNLNIDFKINKSISNLNTTVIFDKQIAIHILAKTPIIIYVKDKELAKAYKKRFEKLWKISKNI